MNKDDNKKKLKKYYKAWGDLKNFKSKQSDNKL